MYLQRYGLAVLTVAVALVAALLLQHFHFQDAAVPLLLLAVALTAWYGGPGPAVLAAVLSLMSVAYFFVPPLHTLYIQPQEYPYFIIFASFAALITWFATIRRRVEADLRQARDKLEIEVAQRTQQASLLDLTHDTIFVRDINGVITYWNRGAEEFYGWTQKEAIGKRPADLLRTVFPKPFEEIWQELLQTDRWEGELTHTKADGVQVIVASRWSLQRDQQRRPVAILETGNDITARKSWEEEMQALNQELAKRSSALEASNKELEAFAYSISHDLRAPLRHTAGFAELLSKSAASSLNEKSQRYLAMILEAAKRMGNLIDDLLAFSRMGARNPFLASSGFSFDQYCGRGQRYSLDLFEQGFQRGTVADDLLEPAFAKFVFARVHRCQSCHRNYNLLASPNHHSARLHRESQLYVLEQHIITEGFCQELHCPCA